MITSIADKELTIGPSKTNRNRVGTGTSVKSPNKTDWERRTKADSGFSKKSTSPTKIFDASAPCGIFRIKWAFPYKIQLNYIYGQR